ncbi:uncharacterized protein LOC116655859 isoform X1 [Drosophila ananassae]|uniref:uncharacterized protein LOC116655859 isoform X1 n=1 Tax=Drosophila ananassae TaxID=7217 RepID=UPI001CFFFDE7|nr:uncharacterized protein LOC116655859 isoform X1 [Drosophila ananassae]
MNHILAKLVGPFRRATEMITTRLKDHCGKLWMGTKLYLLDCNPKDIQALYTVFEKESLPVVQLYKLKFARIGFSIRIEIFLCKEIGCDISTCTVPGHMIQSFIGITLRLKLVPIYLTCTFVAIKCF